MIDRFHDSFSLLRTLTLVAAAGMLAPGLLSAGSGCAGSARGPRIETTLLSSVDLNRMTDEMAESLIAADVQWAEKVIVTDRVVNRTNHIMWPGEQELFLVKLRTALSANGTLRQAGVIFVARPDELSEFTAPVPDESESDDRTAGPTHALTATFRTLTNVDRTVRDDVYECAFQLLDLHSNEIVWEDAYAVRYAVRRGEFQ